MCYCDAPLTSIMRTSCMTHVARAGDRKKVAFNTRYDNDMAPGHFRDQDSYRHGATSPTLDNRATGGYQRNQVYATHGDSAAAAPYGDEAHEHKSMGTKLKQLLPCTQVCIWHTNVNIVNVYISAMCCAPMLCCIVSSQQSRGERYSAEVPGCYSTYQVA